MKNLPISPVKTFPCMHHVADKFKYGLHGMCSVGSISYEK